jgi:hypothetical protein
MTVLKKKKIVFKNKIETCVPNINFFGGIRKFCFTNMETVLQKCISNKLFNSLRINVKELAIVVGVRHLG